MTVIGAAAQALVSSRNRAASRASRASFSDTSLKEPALFFVFPVPIGPVLRCFDGHDEIEAVAIGLFARRGGRRTALGAF
jgi:hypothetical protein